MLKERLVSAFADVPNNVLSVGSLLRKGWSLSSSGNELEVRFGGYNLGLVTWQNVPWMFHEVETVMDFPMIAICIGHFGAVEKPMMVR